MCKDFFLFKFVAVVVSRNLKKEFYIQQAVNNGWLGGCVCVCRYLLVGIIFNDLFLHSKSAQTNKYIRKEQFYLLYAQITKYI